MPKTSLQLLCSVFDEMRRAKELHGEGYMGDLRQVVYDSSWSLDKAIEAGEAARGRMEESSSPPAKSDVFLEEVGELMADLRGGFEPTEELVQVAAMALAWLGVDPDDFLVADVE